MSDILIKGMGMPKDCEECQIATVKSYSTWCPLKKCHIKKGYSFRDCPLVELPDSSWHTGTPTEIGWYLLVYTFKEDTAECYGVMYLSGFYESLKKNGIHVRAWQKIVPYNPEANYQQVTGKLQARR